jgi:HK97 family phage major capsid protein
MNPNSAAGKGAVVNPRAEDSYRDAFNNYLMSGGFNAALQVTQDDTGGFTVASEQFVNRLIKKMDDLVFIRGLATVMPVTNAKSLGAPSLDSDPDDADWTSEIKNVNEDAGMKFGKRELSPQLLTKLVKVSQKLLRSSGQGIEALVADRLAYKFAITQEKAFLTGDGNGKPLGVFTASNSGISTNRDVSTGNSTTAMTFDGLKSAKWALKAQYLRNAGWIFHRDGVAQIDKLKDNDGQYLWQPSVQVGAPDLLLSIPLRISEYAPNTFTTGKYTGILGDFSHYWIADALDFSIQRLMELFAATNQVGYIGRLESDGMPVLEEAFVRVKLS